MRRYVFSVCLVVLAIFLPTLIFAWWIEPLHGDLTRIGKLAERDFGPRATPLAIEVKPTGEFLRNPSVLVLGDSFSQQNLWQSILQEQGKHSVKSFDFEKNCLDTWLEASMADKATSVIIVQSVERNLIAKFARRSECRQRGIIPLEVRAEIRRNERHFWPLTIDAMYLGHTALNTAISLFADGGPSKRFMTVNAPLKLDCARFSNRRSDRLLYLAEDDLKASWSEEEVNAAISRILKMQREVEKSGKTFIFLIAPDKSTVYSSCIARHSQNRGLKNINEVFILAGIKTPDITTPFQNSINTTIDLYSPNNTHWSNAGQILAGEVVGRFLSATPARVASKI